MRFTKEEALVQKQALPYVAARCIRTSEEVLENERHPLSVSKLSYAFFWKIRLEHILKTLRFLSRRNSADSRRSRLVSFCHAILDSDHSNCCSFSTFCKLFWKKIYYILKSIELMFCVLPLLNVSN